MYRWYQILVCLLKFDFFFFTGVTMQVGWTLQRSLFQMAYSGLASHPRVTNKLCGVWHHHCCHSCRLDSPYMLWTGCAARNQGVSVSLWYFSSADLKKDHGYLPGSDGGRFELL